MIIKKIISGAQTGADRAALDFAIDNNIPHGGWVPKGRLAEDGVVPSRYDVTEAPSEQYGRRTELNVLDADGTLIISRGELTGGSLLTRNLAEKHGKPCLHVDLNTRPEFQATVEIARWVREHRVAVLNVAGPRASSDPRIYRDVVTLLETVFYLLLLDHPVPGMAVGGMEPPPETLDQAITRLIAELPLKDKMILAAMTEADLDRLHPSLGQYILTNYGLETGNNPLLASCRRTAGDMTLEPDDAVRLMIRQLWGRLRRTHRLRRVK